jgi:NAD(P)-dependent dehydrogenase (short-subunit alcohol dehydrogenase family)
MGIAVVTGARSGIGLELVRQLAGRGTEVVAICRKPSAELDATGVPYVDGCDVTDPATWTRLAAHFAQSQIDLLIQNAGILVPDALGDVEPGDVRRQFEVNALAPLFLTRALLPRMQAGGKIALITSRMGSISDNGSGAQYGYRMSKAALNAAGVSMAHDLKPHGIAVSILHPGAVRTPMTGGSGNVDAQVAVRGLLQRIDELTLETTGRFLHQDGTELPW